MSSQNEPPKTDSLHPKTKTPVKRSFSWRKSCWAAEPGRQDLGLFDDAQIQRDGVAGLAQHLLAPHIEEMSVDAKGPFVAAFVFGQGPQRLGCLVHGDRVVEVGV